MDKKQIYQAGQIGTTRADLWLTRAATENAKRDWINTPSKLINEQIARKRDSIRKPTPCHILVRIGDSHVMAERVLDISLTGAFVEMDPAGLAMGDFVEAIVGFVYEQRQVEHLITAEVVRIAARGVGLRFGAYDNSAYTDLVNLLYTR